MRRSIFRSKSFFHDHRAEAWNISFRPRGGRLIVYFMLHAKRKGHEMVIDNHFYRIYWADTTANRNRLQAMIDEETNQSARQAVSESMVNSFSSFRADAD